MDKADIISLIRQNLGFHDALEESTILLHLDFAQLKYEGGDDLVPLPWFLFDEDYTDVTVADVSSISLPSDFIGLDEDWAFTVTTSTGVVTELNRHAQEDLYSFTESGVPAFYALAYNELQLYPTPDAVYTLGLPHYKRSEKLSTATTSPWFTYFPRLIVYEATMSLALPLRDETLLRLSERLLAPERVNYLTRVEAMRNSQREFIMGRNN